MWQTGSGVWSALLCGSLCLAGCYGTSHHSNDDGTLLPGSGGTSGSGGSSGTSSAAGGSISGSGGSATVGGRGGTSSSGGATSTIALGRACATDAECGDGLYCITAADPSLAGESPPKGLCTVACKADDTCLQYAGSAYCVPFGSAAYCLQGCTTGPTLEAKCQEREEAICSLIGLIPNTTPCTATDECATDELCNDGTCGTMVTACLPQCGSDADCGSGRYCDFYSGLCSTQVLPGAPINSTCNPDATTQECNGICGPSVDGTTGTCTAFCNVGSVYGCGWDGTGVADAACLYPTLIAPDPGAGDVGLCGALCDCNDDCSAAGEGCAPLDLPDLEQIWQRSGYCRPFDVNFTEQDSLACATAN